MAQWRAETCCWEMWLKIHFNNYLTEAVKTIFYVYTLLVSGPGYRLSSLSSHVRSQNCKTLLLASSLSVRPHKTTWLPLNGFSWNFISEVSKICSEPSSSIKIR
jgi:hypothetical protein